MKILYDHQAFQMQYFGGVSKCFCELISRLPEGVEAEISIAQSNNQHLRESRLVKDLQPVTMDHKQWSKMHPGKLMEALYLAANKFLPLNTADSLNRRATKSALLKQDFDVFHPTYFKPEFLRYLGTKPFVLTVHDMMPELYPQFYGQNCSDVVWKRHLVGKAAAIVAVSENTKKDLVRILNVPEEKVSVIYHGGPEQTAPIESPRLVQERYFLYVGQRIFYKNFPQMLEAFSQVKNQPQMQGVKLVCTGAPFTTDEQALIERLSLEPCVMHLHPTDEEMQVLYRDALAFVYPSDYEGFGMPILEAFANGCPVLLNHASCFPEVAGDAALYFRLKEGLSELSECLTQIASWTEEQRSEWVEKGRARLQLFSWQKAAEQLTKVYQSVL